MSYLAAQLWHICGHLYELAQSYLAIILHHAHHLDPIIQLIPKQKTSPLVVSYPVLMIGIELMNRKAESSMVDTDEMVPYSHRPWSVSLACRPVPQNSGR